MVGIETRRTAGEAVGLVLLLCASGVGAQEPAVLPLETEQVVHAREFGRPWALEVGPDGRLYATYPARRIIRIVDPATGSMETVPLAAVALDTFPAGIGWTEGRLWQRIWGVRRTWSSGRAGASPAPCPSCRPGV